jgi:VWFA-related protein
MLEYLIGFFSKNAFQPAQNGGFSPWVFSKTGGSTMCKLALNISAVLLVAFSCVGQEQSSGAKNGTAGNTGTPPQSLETFKVSTRLVVLDVEVTDKKGRAVTDLKAGEITVLEDGKEQKISVFELQQPTPVSAPAKKVELPPNVYSNFSPVPPSRTRNVIVLDTLNSPWTSQTYGKQQLIKFVNETGVNEPTAIFQLSSEGTLRMLQDFTTDRDLLRKAANSVGTELAIPAESTQMNTSTRNPKPTNGERSMNSYYQLRAMHSTQAAFRNLAEILAVFPGRKNLIWISDRYVASHSRESALMQSAFELQRQVDGKGKTVKALVDSHVAVYPVDPAGLSAHPCGATTPAMYATPSSVYATSTSGVGCGANYAIPWMEKLAESTGGKAYYNRNDVAHSIEKGIQDGSTYYVIGYYPSNNGWDGKFREIKVKVNRQDVDVRHRAGYLGSLPTEFSMRSKGQKDQLQRALSLDTPVLDELVFKARMIPPSTATKNRVLVQYAISPSGLDFQRDEKGGARVSVDCVAQAYSQNREVVQTSENTYDEPLDAEAFKRVAKNGFTCDQYLELPEGNYLLKVAVRDNHTGAFGTLETIKVSLSGNKAVEH